MATFIFVVIVFAIVIGVGYLIAVESKKEEAREASINAMAVSLDSSITETTDKIGARTNPLAD